MKRIALNKLRLSDIESVKDSGEAIFIPEGDYGLAEIYHINGRYEVYSIPTFGGKPTLELVDANPQIVLSTIQSWN